MRIAVQRHAGETDHPRRLGEWDQLTLGIHTPLLLVS